MAIRRFVVPVVTDGDEAAEVYSPYFSGKLVSIRYVKASEDNFADGVDFAITSDETGATVWAEDDVNASATRHPRAVTHSTAGADALFADAGEDVLDMIALGSDRLKIVIVDGGEEKAGTFHITVDG